MQTTLEKCNILARHKPRLCFGDCWYTAPPGEKNEEIINIATAKHNYSERLQWHKTAMII